MVQRNKSSDAVGISRVERMTVEYRQREWRYHVVKYQIRDIYSPTWEDIILTVMEMSTLFYLWLLDVWHYFSTNQRGWHMADRNWRTVVLDGWSCGCLLISHDWALNYHSSWLDICSKKKKVQHEDFNRTSSSRLTWLSIKNNSSGVIHRYTIVSSFPAFELSPIEKMSYDDRDYYQYPSPRWYPE